MTRSCFRRAAWLISAAAGLLAVTASAGGTPATTQPATLPPQLIKAIDDLIKIGFPDPAGCEYRPAHIHIRSVERCISRDVEIHGWVLPQAPGSNGARSVIAWNGLIYPATQIGEKADVDADVTAACDADEKVRAENLKKDDRARVWVLDNVSPEDAIGTAVITPVRACLVYRFGKFQLAQRLWNDCISGMGRKNAGEIEFLDDPFHPLAEAWLMSRFDRMLGAFTESDDARAIVEARAIIDAQAKADPIFVQHGFQKLEGFSAAPAYFPQLEVVPTLLADFSRRSGRAPATKPASAPETGAQRINRLIIALEDTVCPTPDERGWRDRIEDGNAPQVQALVREGEPAIEPLLDCYLHDERFTRFVSGPSIDRRVEPVREAALAAVKKILNENNFPLPPAGNDEKLTEAEQRARLVSAIRWYWVRYRDHVGHDRWLEILADDSAHNRWLQAAEHIAELKYDLPPEAPGEPLKSRLVGEDLRNRQDPSVAELLIKRMNTLAAGSRDLDAGCRICDCLVRWDGPHQQAALAAFTPLLLKDFDRSREESRYFVSLRIAGLYRTRIELGDAHALAEYANWVVRVSPLDDYYSGGVLRLMWRFQQSPEMEAAANQIVNSELWSPLFRERKTASKDPSQILHLPDIGIKVFQKKALELLDDTAVVGTVQLQPDGSAKVKARWPVKIDPQADREDPLRPRDQQPRDIRYCDVVAHALSELDGFPHFMLYWPLPDRDQAIAQAKRILQQYGDRLAWSPIREGDHAVYASMIFPQLDHPATAKDVADGIAIFSLDQHGRIVKLAQYPTPADVPGLKIWARIANGYDQAAEKVVVHRDFQNSGNVWQAEEVLENGQRKRYYGFVGFGIIAKIPEDQIQLHPPPPQ